MDKALVRCPYCVEDGNFKIMTKGGEGTWYVCDRCTHTVVPDDPGYRCTCVRCTQVNDIRRDL